MHRCSRVLGHLVAGLLCASAAAQNPQTSAQSAAKTPGQSSTHRTPLPLDVDRDPVPSPDPDTPASASQTAPSAPGVGPITKDRTGRYTIERDAYEVRLNASVLDGSGRLVQNLDQNAFHVYEDGVPQSIVSFRHEDLPVSIGLLIDSSGSMYDKRTAVDKASLDLVKLSNPQDEEFLVDFSSEAFIDQDFTSSLDKLQQGLTYIKSSGGTAAYDALVAAADYLARNAKNPKQVLVVVTDGEDNASSSTLDDAIRRIQDLDGPVIYCIGLLFGDDTDKHEVRHARTVLENIARQTGGVAYFPRSLKEVDPASPLRLPKISAPSTASPTALPTRPSKAAIARSTSTPAPARPASTFAPAPATSPKPPPGQTPPLSSPSAFAWLRVPLHHPVP